MFNRLKFKPGSVKANDLKKFLQHLVSLHFFTLMSFADYRSNKLSQEAGKSLAELLHVLTGLPN